MMKQNVENWLLANSEFREMYYKDITFYRFVQSYDGDSFTEFLMSALLWMWKSKSEYIKNVERNSFQNIFVKL